MGGRRPSPRPCRGSEEAAATARLLRADGGVGGASIKPDACARDRREEPRTPSCRPQHIPRLSSAETRRALTDDVFADGHKRAAAAADDDEAETEDDHADDASERRRRRGPRRCHRRRLARPPPLNGVRPRVRGALRRGRGSRARRPCAPPDESAVVAASPRFEGASPPPQVRRRVHRRRLPPRPARRPRAAAGALPRATPRPAPRSDGGGDAAPRLRPAIDPHVPNLLVFPRDGPSRPSDGARRTARPSGQAGLPAAALAPEPGWEVLDCCAAPE